MDDVTSTTTESNPFVFDSPYRLDSNRYFPALMCRGVDIDECAVNSGGCNSQLVCVNTPGSFECLCPVGYNGDAVNRTGELVSVFIICLFVNTITSDRVNIL